MKNEEIADKLDELIERTMENENLFERLSELTNKIDDNATGYTSMVANVETSNKLDELIVRAIKNEELIDKVNDLGYRLESYISVVDQLEKSTVLSVEKLKKSVEDVSASETKFNKMIGELNGAVARCRALFKEQLNKKPIWYVVGDVPFPASGEVWIKDIDGNETIGTCKGLALLYPADSSLKEPQFWKPV